MEDVLGEIDALVSIVLGGLDENALEILEGA